MDMDKQITQSILVMLCSMRGTKIAKVEGMWPVNRPKRFVSEDPDDSPKVWLCSPFTVPSLNSTSNPCVSFHDVIIVCSNLQAGKPLHMHIRNVGIHLCICQHPHWNPEYSNCIQTLLSFH